MFALSSFDAVEHFVEFGGFDVNVNVSKAQAAALLGDIIAVAEYRPLCPYWFDFIWIERCDDPL